MFSHSRRRITQDVWIALARVGAIGAFLYLSFWIASRYAQGTLRIGLEMAPFVLGPAVLFCVFRWRLGIFPVLLLVSFEGILVVLNRNPQIYLAKDVLFGAMFFGLLAESLFGQKRLLFRSPMNVVLVGLLVLGLVQALNPDGGGLLVVVLGLRSLFIYTTAAYVVYAACTTREQVVRLALFIMITAIPIEIYGVYQFTLGPHAFEEQFGIRAIEFDVGPDGSQQYFRPVSTFAAPGQFGGFQLFTTLVTLGVVNLPSLGRGPRFIAWIALIVSVLGTGIAGQRSNYVLLLVSLPILVLLRGLSFRSLPQIAIPALAGLVLALTIAGPFLTSRFGSLTLSSRLNERETPVLEAVLPGLMLALQTATTVAPVGHGIGLTLPSARHLSESGESVFWAESFFVSVSYQLGALGLVLTALLFIIAVRRAFMAARAHGDDDLAWLAAVLGCYVLVIFWLSFPYAPLYAFPAAVYFWVAVGLIERIVDLVGPAPRRVDGE